MRARATILAFSMLATPGLALAGDRAASAVSDSDIAKDMDHRPAFIKVGQSSIGAILTDEKGRTLYAMDAGITRSRYGVGTNYCRSTCAQKWSALSAPAGAAPVGRWKVVTGATGPQWAWDGNPVFTYVADTGPGSIAGNDYDDLWTVIAYVPPVPLITAPAAVSIVYADGAYSVTDDQGRRLFTATCADACKDMERMDAGLANRDVGSWQVSRDGDRAHWLFKGQPVFVASGPLPKGATAIRP